MKNFDDPTLSIRKHWNTFYGSPFEIYSLRKPSLQTL